jgi:hemolysin III
VLLPEYQVEGVFATLDYIGIYLLIAGTFTPVAAIVLTGLWRWATLSLTWGLAAVGITLRLVPLDISRSLSTGLYIAMGWCVILCYFKLARMLTHRGMRLAVIGGLVYTVGAVLNWVHWPELWRGYFSTHELWHLFVMAGSLMHFWFMFTVVVPFEHPLESVQAEPAVEPFPAVLLPQEAQG